MVPLPDASQVICPLRMKVPVLLTFTGGCHVVPLSVEKVTWRAPPPTLKLFHETYIRPKNGEDELLSAQPDSRSSLPLVCAQKCVQLFGSVGLVDLYPPKVQLPLASIQTVNQVAVGLLYKKKGGPKGLAKGVWAGGLGTRGGGVS